jgi:hypothetical protein
MNVVTVFEDPTSNRIVGMAYLDECRTIMAGFMSTRLTHCSREANQAADLIAKSVDVSSSIFLARRAAFVSGGRCNHFYLIIKVTNCFVETKMKLLPHPEQP